MRKEKISWCLGLNGHILPGSWLFFIFPTGIFWGDFIFLSDHWSGGPDNYLLLCHIFPMIRLPFRLLCSLAYLHISLRTWGILGFCSTDFVALGKAVGLYQVLLALIHLQAIYILCPFHAGCRQMLWHVFHSGAGSLSIERCQTTWRFYYFPSLHPQTHHTCSCSLPLSRGSLPLLEWEKLILTQAYIFFFKFIDDRNIRVPQTCGDFSFRY